MRFCRSPYLCSAYNLHVYVQYLYLSDCSTVNLMTTAGEGDQMHRVSGVYLQVC